MWVNKVPKYLKIVRNVQKTHEIRKHLKKTLLNVLIFPNSIKVSRKIFQKTSKPNRNLYFCFEKTKTFDSKKIAMNKSIPIKKPARVPSGKSCACACDA